MNQVTIAENPVLSGNFGPVHSEDDFVCEVSGDFPRDLAGSLYRNGPNPQFVPAGDHHWFHGDGMIHAFHIENGQVRYANRFARTPKWLVENGAGEQVYGARGKLLRPELAPAAGDVGLANTNVVWHGGQLLALEENHPPFAMDHRTLASAGYRDFHGHVTAHPKFDPETGEMVFFAYGADGPLTATLSYGVADRTGAVIRRDTFTAPYCSMIHDFMVTRDHVLFPVLPLTGDADRARAGLPVYAWEPDKGAFVGVMRRDATVDSVRWFSVDPCYVYHVMNAYDHGDTIVADVMQFTSAPLFPNPDGSPRAPVASRMARWTFDLAATTDRISCAYIDDLAGDFPRFDERRSGLSYRHGWFAGQRERPGGLEFDRLVHLDLLAGGRQIWELPRGDQISEPVFVPRTPDAAEGDGWLLAVAYRAQDDVSDLVVLEALDIARGPVATARLPRRVPNGFHGNWRPAG